MEETAAAGGKSLRPSSGPEPAGCVKARKEDIMTGGELSLEMLHEVAGIFQRCKEMEEESAREAEQKWRELAGDCLDEILESTATAETYLLNPSPSLRLVALAVLTSQEHASPYFARVCEQLSLQDSDPLVRIQAVGSLGACYAETNDSRIGKLLARLVRDERETELVRSCAYESFLQLRGYSDPHWEAWFLKPGIGQFPHDVNWALLDASLRSTGRQ